MAIGFFDFHSQSLRRCVTFRVILPNDVPDELKQQNPHFQRPMKTLMLLHGYSGSCSDWVNGSLIAELSNKYHLAVICPAGENSFYLDGKEAGRKYGTYVGEELIQYARKTFGLSDRMEDTYVGGLSMGGFGAIHTGLLYNHTFSKVFALSSALIVHNVEKITPGFEDPAANYDYYKMVFGEPSELSDSVNNPEELIRRIQKEGDRMPAIYMACGTQDFLIQENHLFRDFLTERGVEFTYHESSGEHDWVFWNQYLEPAVKWLLECE
ncbi:MAG: acetylesterase [Eubacterium sp.]|nr:acetylesterase [Eubacterium sp.]